MMLERVEVLGFRSIKDFQVFDVPEGPGFYLLTGKNEDEPRLGANGAGKTTLWEAVTWCAYGKTAAGLRGPEVRSWHGGQGTYASIRVAGNTITRADTKLKLNGEEASQEEVNAAIGADFDLFTRVHYHAQHAPSFLDMGATEKVELLSSALGLDKWLDYSKRAASMAADESAVLTQLREKQAGASRLLEGLHPDTLMADLDDWDRKQRDRVAAAKAELQDLLESAKELKQPDYAEEQRARKDLQESTELLRELEEVLQKARDTAAAALADAAAAARVPEDVCPTCNQEVDASQWAFLQGRHTRLSNKAADAINERTAAAEDVADAKELVESHRRALAALERANADYHTAHTYGLRAIDRARRDLEDLKQAVNPIQKVLDRNEELRKTLLAEVQRRAGAIKLYESRVDTLTAWVSRFKDVRLFQITEALAQLEVEVNAELVQLGLVDWRINFAPDAETKGGKMKRGFSVMIECPQNTRPVPWAAWSGGEKQRLRVACEAGLSSLIASVAGIPTLVEVWDEPTTGMSEEGVDDLLSALKERSRTRQVWLIDHRALSSGAFDGVFIAAKRNGSTCIERKS